MNEKLDQEQRQRANELVMQMSESQDMDKFAYEIIFLRDALADCRARLASQEVCHDH